MRPVFSSSLAAVTLVGALTLLGSAGAEAVRPAESSAAQRVVVTPKPGKVIRTHRALLQVRAPGLSGALHARLNGVRIGEDFALPRRGVRTLRATASHGLHRGKNVLVVRVRRRGKAARKARVRFRVRSSSPLVGAGRDRRVVAGNRIRLAGVAKGPAADPSKLRWRVVDTPAPLEPAGEPPPLAGLSSPSGKAAGFRPAALGTYTLKLTHGSGRSATSDRLRIDAVPPNPLVSLRTQHMTPEGIFDGIRVGDHLYPNERWLQVLVLDRKTLAPISNASFSGDQAAQLRDQISKLDDETSLVIVATGGFINDRPDTTLPTDDLLKRIGVPPICEKNADCLALPGRFSAIGVPGMEVGEADWNDREAEPSAEVNGGLNGYLSPDQYLNYGFVPAERQAFQYGGKEVAPCPSGTICGTSHIGYRLEVRDARTLEPWRGDGQVFDTNGRGLTAAQQSAEADRMTAELKAVPDGNVITIQVVSNREGGESRYPAPVGAISRSSMTSLAHAVARAGGTRNAFNRMALQTGAPGSGGAIYTLVGWANAGEGSGAEVAALDGAGDAPMLSGALRPDRSSEFRPAEVTYAAANPQILQDLLVAEPTGVWPLDDVPGARRAIAYLGSTDQRLGPDPRSAYWTQAFGESTTNSIIAGLKSAPLPSDAKFSASEFEAARAQLIKELGWVGNVRTYMKSLSSPFAENALPSWVAAQTITDKIYNDANKPEDEVAFKWVEFTRIILGLLGPVTHEVSAVVGHMLDLGVWMYGASSSGAPSDSEVRTKADEIGAELVEQAQQAQATYARMGDVLVSDYDKLAVVGPSGGCNVSSSDCPPELAFSAADRNAASADVYRSIERVAYAKLLPLGYHLFALNIYEGATAPFPPNYQCNFYFPWEDYNSATPHTAWALLQELDPATHNGSWDTYTMSKPPGTASVHGTPPSNELLNRMFDPVSVTGNPKLGGLGMSQARLTLESDHDYWFGSAGAEGRRCHWVR